MERRQKFACQINLTVGFILYLYRANAPAVFPLVPNAGKEGNAVLAGGFQHGVIRLADLGNAGDSIRPGSLLGGQGDPVPVLQGVDFSEVAVGPPVVGREGDVAIPNAGVGEVATVKAMAGIFSVPRCPPL